ncbi:ABC transporter permease [Gemmata sp. JC673]|uniref:ABC transporter permease n=1 Tax=Gemmata algarum TaxID=2975278 RepID=A0ABU5F293_9BACT|nr:ABC transporter permease [Gemmata algarum]MDY3559979.1 ABC transporter permease [Gemmata algarum]
MQFLAFLQDSYREAKSGWVLQVMLVLAALLILLIASVGFRPVTLRDELDDHLELYTRLLDSNPESGRPKFSVENVTSTNTAEPWKADYAFEFVVACATPEDMKKANRPGLPVSRSEVDRMLQSELQFLNDVKVTGGPPELEKPEGADAKKDANKTDANKTDAKDAPKKALPTEVRYQVTTKGTKVEDRLAWRHKVSILFVYEIPHLYRSLRDCVYYLEKYLVNWVAGSVLLFVAVVITAGFIPNMLAKGSLDLFVSKPIGRVRLLVYKYVGGLTFVLILTTVTVLGVWLAIGVRTGLWPLNFLSIIPVITFCFAVLYAFSTLAAVLTRSTLVAILLTGVAWGLLWGVGKVNDGIESRREQAAQAKPQAGTPEAVLREVESEQPLWGFIPRSTFPVFSAIHTITPRTYEMDDRLVRVIAEGVLTPNELKAKEYDRPIRTSWAEMVLVSLCGIGTLLGISAWRFAARDY